MKKVMFSMAALALMMGALVSGCTSSEQKVKNAEETLIEANEALKEANADYLADMEQFRMDTEAKIITNDQIIAELKGRLSKMKIAVRIDAQNKIAELEEKNAQMKRRIADYKDEGRDNWYSFKNEFNRDMEALGKALSDFVTNSNK
jgi:hypothetical protein